MSKGSPEVQIHAALSIVRHGDHYGITKDSRKDEIKELKQLAAQFPVHSYGMLSKSHVRAAFSNLCEEFIKEMRSAGLLKAGE